MDELLNSIEIPNGIGFEITPDTTFLLLENEKNKDIFIDMIGKSYISIFEKYGIVSYIPMYAGLCIHTNNNKKVVSISNSAFLDSFFNFFNYSENEYNEIIKKGIFFFDYDGYEKIRKMYVVNIIRSLLKKKIKELKLIKTLEELKSVSNIFYDIVNSTIKENNYNKEEAYECFKYMRDDLIRSLTKTRLHANELVDFINKPLSGLDRISFDSDKAKLFLSGQYILFSTGINEPYKNILFDSSLRLYKSIKNKNVSLKGASFYIGNDDICFVEFDEPFDVNALENMIQGAIDNGFVPKKNILEHYSREDFKGKSINEIRNFVLNEIEQTIEKSAELGSKIMDPSEMDAKYKKLEEKTKDKNISASELKRISHQLQKLHMVMKEVKPRAIHEGQPPFKGFYIYFYDNGMVAIDKIDYGARLFVMPVSTYKYILDNEIKKLRQVGRLDSVIAFKHDERTDWLGKAKQTILNSTEYVTEADKKYNEQIEGWSFGYTQEDIDKIKKTIESLEKDASLSNDEKSKIKKEIEEKTEKKIKKKQKSDKIDRELKQSNPMSEEEMTKKDNDELATLEKELDEKLGMDAEFDELYEEEKKLKKKVPRSVSVAKFGKDRTIDDYGMYHCEMCNTTYSIEQKSRLDYHHFVPISKGGPDTLYNGICLCTECHRIIHNEPYRIPISTQGYILSLIEKHIKEENPELLDKFIEYKNTFFPYINELVSDERARLKKQGLPESMIDIIVKEKEELFSREPQKYVKGLELRYHK